MTSAAIPAWIREEGGGVLLRIHARPGASKTVVGPVDPWRKALAVSVAAKAQDGEANKELVRALALALNVGASCVSVERGARNRDKVLRVEGLSLAEVRKALEGVS